MRVSLQVAFQDQAEAGWKQYVAVLRPFALADEHLALLKIDVFNPNAHQLAHPHGGVEQELQHDLVLDVAAVLDHSEEALERCLAQQLRHRANRCSFHPASSASICTRNLCDRRFRKASTSLNWNGTNNFILYGKGGEIASNDLEN